jgi:CRP-like cAMP-binding protein
MELDRDLLLTAEHLRLEDGLIRGKTVRGTFAFKRMPSQTYLVVDTLQAQLLDEFMRPQNVPAALESCIRKRTCPPLREFYDLILKAHRAGILRSEEIGADGPPPATHAPVRWFLRLPGQVLLPLTALAVLATAIVAILRPPAVPPDGLAGFIGWAATCGAVSLGHLLAACVLRHAGGEIVHPRFQLFSFTPHFTIDFAEACMLARGARAAVYAVTLLPLASLVALALWQRQPWAAIPLGALLLHSWPVGEVVEKLVVLLRRAPHVATDEPAMFDAPSTPLDEFRAAWRRIEGRVVLAQTLAALAWSLAVGAAAYRLLDLPLKLAWEHRADWRTPTLVLLGAVAALMLLRFASHVQHRVIDAFLVAYRRWRVWLRRWRGRVDDIDAEQIEALVRRHPLLRRLDANLQLELVSRLQPLRARPWQTLMAFDQPPPYVALVLSGRATLHRRLKSGRKERFLDVVEGDLFGAHALIDPELGNLEVRTRTPFAAAMLSIEDFQRLVLTPLGAPAVRRYAQNHLFLQRASPLCAEWRPTAVARFAELAATSTHPSGGKILAQGQEVASLYVLYEGRAHAVRDKKSVGKLSPGDFFGEISLLQTSAATADVQTKDDARCLVVNRVEFIRFLSRNHHVALQLEKLCSSRLGRPIFPLNGQHTFDV